MNAEEKIKRLLQDDWEIHGDPKLLLRILREMHLSLRRTAGYVANHTNDQWAKDYLKAKLFPKFCVVCGREQVCSETGYCSTCFEN